ncbi:MAG: hypothetical protein IV100_05800 [Myxococcales bacterium]|nr:hypothetical protein [Myxococcales bacterium]
MDTSFFKDPEMVLGTVARMFAADGAAPAVAVLAHGAPEVVQTGYDNWNGGTYTYELLLRVPYLLHGQLGDSVAELEKSILPRVRLFLGAEDENHQLAGVSIRPAVEVDTSWRQKATTWLTGAGVNNQGRVRSLNVAPLSADGLLFRSPPEIELYRALKSAGVSFAPLPVFVRGGTTYSRIEPDFVIIQAGVVLALEVDGDTVHTETPAEAHARTRMLQHEGVNIERIHAHECATPEAAKNAVVRILAVIAKIKAART